MNEQHIRVPRFLILFASLASVAVIAACGTGSGHVGGPPSSPTAFTASPAHGQVSLTWAANAPSEVVQSYNLYWGPKSPVGVGYTPNMVTTSTNSVVVSGLTDETTYYFVVTAVNAAGESLRSKETSALPLHSSAKGIGAGFTHSCAILSDGVTVCWGENSNCELGNDCKQVFSPPDNFHSNFPVRVDENTAAIEIAAGEQSTCALLSDGTIDCWGAGALGNGMDGSVTPVSVSGIDDGFMISAGRAHTCSVLRTGRVKCWGEDTDGQVGLNPHSAGCMETNDVGVFDCPAPAEVAGISTAVIVAAGGSHSCAVLSTGEVECWGKNDAGQLGNGTTTSSSAPVQVSGIVDALGVVAGNAHTCAVLGTGQIACWGDNSFGQLGKGGTTGSSVPVTVPGIAGVTGFSAGSNHTCAVLSTGGLECWGLNSDGQLGDGTTRNESLPAPVSGISTAIGVSAGDAHTCALLSGGGVDCWGSNALGQLGNGGVGNASHDVLVPDAVSGIVNLGTQPLAITTTSVPGATQGNAYSTQLQATGGAAPYAWSVTAGALPTGLALSSGGVLSGTPAHSGTFDFTVQVTDASQPVQSDTKALTLQVTAATGVTLVSADAIDPTTGGNSASRLPVISTTGRYVAFVSASTNLVSPPPSQPFTLWLRDTCIGAPAGCIPSAQFLDVDNSGQILEGLGFVRSIDGDGSIIGLDYGPTNVTFGYIRDACPQAGLSGCPASTTQLVDSSGNMIYASFTTLSRSGRYVAFSSLASGQGGTVRSDIYLRDTCLGTPPNTCIPKLTLVVPGGDTYPAFNAIQAVDAFGDILYQGTNGQLFLVNSGGGFVPNGNPVSVGSDGAAVVAVDTGASMSDTGRFVSFTAAGTSDPANRQIYLRDTCAQSTSCYNPSTILVSASASVPGEDDGDNTSGQESISQDGRYVAFVSSANDASPGGTGNPSGSAFLGYVRDTCIGTPAGTCTPSTHLVTLDAAGGQLSIPAETYSVPMSGDGHSVTFPWQDPKGVLQVVIAPTGF